MIFIYSYRLRRMEDLVRSRILKPRISKLAVVITSQYLPLHVFDFLTDFWTPRKIGLLWMDEFFDRLYSFECTCLCWFMGTRRKGCVDQSEDGKLLREKKPMA